MEEHDLYRMMHGGHEILNNMYDKYVEEDEWIDSFLGEEEEVIRHIVG